MNFTPSNNPKLSVIIPSFNGGRFIRDTVNSILSQTSKDFEIIVIDGASTDETLAILSGCKGLKIISEPDNGYSDAFLKGLKMAKGKYIMQCCISDGLLDPTWIKECIKILDADKDISLVWGLISSMTEDGKLSNISLPRFENCNPSQKENIFYYWLSSGSVFPEGNFIVRKNVLEKCFPPPDVANLTSVDAWLEFNYRFHAAGYLSYFLNKVASFGRVHGNSITVKISQSDIAKARAETYINERKSYRKKILLHPERHIFRDGDGKPLKAVFSRAHFLFNEFFSPVEILKRIISFPKPFCKRCVYFLFDKKIIPEFLLVYLRKKSRQLRFFCSPYW